MQVYPNPTDKCLSYRANIEVKLTYQSQSGMFQACIMYNLSRQTLRNQSERYQNRKDCNQPMSVHPSLSDMSQSRKGSN